MKIAVLLALLIFSGCAKYVYFADLKGELNPVVPVPEAKAQAPRLFSQNKTVETLSIDFTCSLDFVELTLTPGPDGKLRWSSFGKDEAKKGVYISKPELGKAGLKAFLNQEICVVFDGSAFEDNEDLEDAKLFAGKEVCGPVQKIKEDQFVVTRACPK